MAGRSRLADLTQMSADMIEVMQPTAKVTIYRGRIYVNGEPLRR